LGVRRKVTERYVLERSTKEVETKYGKIRVKIAKGDGFEKVSPEYEDCRKIAKREGVSIREVSQGTVLLGFNRKFHA